MCPVLPLLLLGFKVQLWDERNVLRGDPPFLAFIPGSSAHIRKASVVYPPVPQLGLGTMEDGPIA